MHSSKQLKKFVKCKFFIYKLPSDRERFVKSFPRCKKEIVWKKKKYLRLVKVARSLQQ